MKSTDERFQSQTAPDGSAWTPLWLVTIAARLMRGGNASITIFGDDGDLAGSANYRASDQVSLGDPVLSTLQFTNLGVMLGVAPRFQFQRDRISDCLAKTNNRFSKSLKTGSILVCEPVLRKSRWRP